MSAVLTEDEKARIRHHLGYILLDPVPSITLGVRGLGQPQFLVELALNQIPENAVGIIRNYVAIMDGIENQLVEAQRRFKAEKLGEITLRKDETDQLEREYARWAKRLADDLGVPLNMFSERFRTNGGMMPLSVSVQH
jgi:hypothetical protein